MERTDMPDELVRDVGGDIVFEQILPQVIIKSRMHLLTSLIQNSCYFCYTFSRVRVCVTSAIVWLRILLLKVICYCPTGLANCCFPSSGDQPEFCEAGRETQGSMAEREVHTTG